MIAGVSGVAQLRLAFQSLPLPLSDARTHSCAQQWIVLSLHEHVRNVAVLYCKYDWENPSRDSLNHLVCRWR